MRLALHVMPHDVLMMVMHVAKKKYIWLEQLKAACAIFCAGGQRNKPHFSPPVSTSLTRQWPAEIQRSTRAAPGREGCSRAKSRNSTQWYHLELLPTRNLSSCVPCAPAERKEKQSNVFILLGLSAQMPTIRGQRW